MQRSAFPARRRPAPYTPILTRRDSRFSVRFVKNSYRVLIVLGISVPALVFSCARPEMDEERAAHDALQSYESAIIAFGEPLPPIAQAWMDARAEVLVSPEEARLPLDEAILFNARDPNAFAWLVATSAGRYYEARYEAPFDGVMLDLHRMDGGSSEDAELVRIGESLDGTLVWYSPAGAKYVLRAQAELLTRGEVRVLVREIDEVAAEGRSEE